MYIGYMGSVVFIVSSRYMLTPANVQQSASGRWQDHEIIYKKPSSEFLGPELQDMSFDIILASQYGINPKTEYEVLRNMCETGAVFPLIIGGRPVSHNYWTLRSVQLGETYYTPTGKLMWAKASVSLKEYDNSNYAEEKSKLNLYGPIANVLTAVF